MGLFELGDFTLHSGKKSNFKLECDALTSDDWECIAQLLLDRLPKFRIAVGIPKGGVHLASILEKYSTRLDTDPILVVDDVYTTGTSFKEYLKNRDGNYIGAVVFCRAPIHEDWIFPLFEMQHNSKWLRERFK